MLTERDNYFFRSSHVLVVIDRGHGTPPTTGCMFEHVYDLERNRCKSMEEHYQKLCAVVTSRAILSLGVACFKWSNSGFSKTGPVPLEARVFNVWLLTQQPFVTDPSSAQFLILHGFDFNKQYSVGLPYCPPSARTKVRV